MSHVFARLASRTARWAGSYIAFLIAFVIVLGWACTGPLFNFSQTWQLVINTGTTIVTFLMVFLIQNSQNRDSKAIHLKLDELIRSIDNANNVLIDAEHDDDEQLDRLRDIYHAISREQEVLKAEALRIEMGRIAADKRH